MALPYVPPDPIPTTLRCQFSLPGRKYNCRCVGKFMLDGKRYCAPHYDIAWKVANPVYGQQHEWKTVRGVEWKACSRCAAVQQREGLPQEPCRGGLPTIRLWSAGVD